MFGDGAGAIAIEANSKFDNLIGYSLRTDGERFIPESYIKYKDSIINDVNYMKGGFSSIQMNGQEVYKFAVKEVPIILENLFKRTNYNSEQIDWLCFIKLIKEFLIL